MQHRQSVREEEVLKLLEKGPATPDEVAQEIGTAWATAQGILLKLAAEGTVTALRKGKVNVYLLKYPSAVGPRVPSWVKPRRIEDLARELEPYFEKGRTASEMVRKERRRD